MNASPGQTVKANTLVSLQFISLFALIFTTSRFDNRIIAVTLCFLGIMLAAWAIASMRRSKLRITPVPDANAILITIGPYKFIRHPMYTSIIVAVTGLLFSDFTWVRFFIAVALFIVLIIKLGWEEQMLLQKFPMYGEYLQKTFRLIPGIF